jgi:uncharacterized protein YdiU (UPF0061 family)
MNAPFELRHLNSAAGLAVLGEAFVQRVPTEPLTSPHWLAWNSALAQQLGLPDSPNEEWLARLSGASSATPWCSVYSGHQFGVWAGQLGDGRAHTLGTLQRGDALWEVQLKGSGKTPYSRMGDGRAVLRSSVREYLCSEAMAGLGIPTTRALAVTGSAQPVRRETMETAAIVTRLAPSFIRFGHFEHFAHHDQHAALQHLTDYVIATFYPDCATAAVPALALLEAVTARTARLMAQWQAVGFCHGVMNSDNMSILGLTLDYGPFGFMDAFNSNHICNHTDSQGRYAYGQQPRVGQWNCGALASALLPLIKDVAAARAVLDGYSAHFDAAFVELFRAKLGLSLTQESDAALIAQLMELLDNSGADFTVFFRSLALFKVGDPATDGPLRDQVLDRAAFDVWAAQYRARLQQESRDDAARAQAMRRVNPKYVLRNYLAELAIQDAQAGELRLLEELKQVLDSPFDEHPEHEEWAGLPPDWAGHLSVSCSS